LISEAAHLSTLVEEANVYFMQQRQSSQ